MPKGGPGCLPCLNVSSSSQKGQQCYGCYCSTFAELTVVEETYPLFLSPTNGLGVHIWFPSNFKHTKFSHGAWCWERHICLTKATTLYVKHEIGPKVRKYLSSFATQSTTWWLLHLSCCFYIYFLSLVVRDWQDIEKRHSEHFKREWIKCDTECCIALVLKHRTWVVLLTWKPVRLNNLQ